jgi:hypothetical protein
MGGPLITMAEYSVGGKRRIDVDQIDLARNPCLCRRLCMMPRLSPWISILILPSDDALVGLICAGVVACRICDTLFLPLYVNSIHCYYEPIENRKSRNSKLLKMLYALSDS